MEMLGDGCSGYFVNKTLLLFLQNMSMFLLIRFSLCFTAILFTSDSDGEL